MKAMNHEKKGMERNPINKSATLKLALSDINPELGTMPAYKYHRFQYKPELICPF